MIRNFNDTTADEIIKVFLAGFDDEVFEWMNKEELLILPCSNILYFCGKLRPFKSDTYASLAFFYNEKGEIAFLQFTTNNRFNQLKAFKELKKLNLSFEGEKE